MLNDPDDYSDSGSWVDQCARAHRWNRGDWQLLPWMLGWKAKIDQMLDRQPIRALSFFQMWDNIRRSLIAPGSLISLLIGWLLPQFAIWIPSFFIVSSIMIPTIFDTVINVLPHHHKIPKKKYWLDLIGDLCLAVERAFFLICFLPYEAYSNLDAAIVTISRLFSGKHLLVWVSAAQTQGDKTGVVGVYRRMFVAPLIAVIVTFLMIYSFTIDIDFYIIFLLLFCWFLSPLIAWYISRPYGGSLVDNVDNLTERYIRLTARRTWHFFEWCVTPSDNHLPPDNLQVDPNETIAHRTSPTNIGLYLLSLISAFENGWLGSLDLLERVEATFKSINTLTRYRGHLFNWYATKSLLPLEPRYVSTVDSGNFCACLLVMRRAALNMSQEFIYNSKRIIGICDTFEVAKYHLESAIQKYSSLDLEDTELLSQLRIMENHINQLRLDTFSTSQKTKLQEDELITILPRLANLILHEARKLQSFYPVLNANHALEWSETLCDTIASHGRDVLLLNDIPTPSTLLGLSRKRTTRDMLKRRDILNCPNSPLPLPSQDSLIESWKNRWDSIASSSLKFFLGMNFFFLYNSRLSAFTIGYNVSTEQIERSHYELLASEARLASYIAIAKGEVPASHWFKLGRKLTPIDSTTVLLSWTGSMFEYLMPDLILNTPEESLIGRSNRAAVRGQISYAKEEQLPCWGISESAYSQRDSSFTYQYSPFGVPKLALGHSLSESFKVIAPYASMLAINVMPVEAVENLKLLENYGALGDYGFYEAVDFTMQEMEVKIIKAHFSHHQGMALVAITNMLNNDIIRKLFAADPIVQSAELLLQERMPRSVPVVESRELKTKNSFDKERRSDIELIPRCFGGLQTLVPRCSLLANGRYSVMLTHTGSGYSIWLDKNITRWSPDPTTDLQGSFLFLRKVNDASSDLWSSTLQPLWKTPDEYSVSMREDQVCYTRKDADIFTTTRIVVSSSHDVELREVQIQNTSDYDLEIELTSYMELVLAPLKSDTAHPAFSKLFIETSFDKDLELLIATRRPRDSEHAEIWCGHVMISDSFVENFLQHECSRLNFLGRGNSIRNASAIRDAHLSLSSQSGQVLDPIFSMRRRVKCPANCSTFVTLATMTAPSLADLLYLADFYNDVSAMERVSLMASTYCKAQMNYLSMNSDLAHLYQFICENILYPRPGLSKKCLENNFLGQCALWGHKVSGDLPIILVIIDSQQHLPFVRELVRVQKYGRMKVLAFDLVVLNDQPYSYEQDLGSILFSEADQSPANATTLSTGGFFVFKMRQLAPVDRVLFHSIAVLSLDARHGTFEDQISSLMELEYLPISIEVARERTILPPQGALLDRQLTLPSVEFFNGFGGFSDSGETYSMMFNANQWAPLPWSNVLSNPEFGSIVTEAGGSYTWSQNALLNQLSFWSNDAVSDPPSEIFYVVDEDTKNVTTPTLLPIRDNSPYKVVHGKGFSSFEHNCMGLRMKLLQLVPVQGALKISEITITNYSDSTRNILVIPYVKLVLGMRDGNRNLIVTSFVEESNAIFARNPWNDDYGSRVAFLASVDAEIDGWTCERREFIGNGSTEDNPAFGLHSKFGSVLDPCAALSSRLELKPGQTRSIRVFFGQGYNRSEAEALISNFKKITVKVLMNELTEFWKSILDSWQVKTPDRAFDIFTNSWLLYQVVSSRLFARAGFSQAGGAFGFRDQLQDVMALTSVSPGITREFIIRAASRQFLEGDVQHWWHPSGKGIRTHISDDLLWLPYTAMQYIDFSGDKSILDEQIPFLEGPILGHMQDDWYGLPHVSRESGSLFEHCARAIDYSLQKIGSHGLPLMGTGDWNDGMNRVGVLGKGESCWLAWFLIDILTRFSQYATAFGEMHRFKRWQDNLEKLKIAMNTAGWGGCWYRRAFYDDGTPLGDESCIDCKIDSISQSWAVISGGAPREKAECALYSVLQHLVSPENGLILLLAPPFREGKHDPGYIRGYLPGIRENGGQYSHASVWTVIAFSLLGNGNKASELFNMLNPINHATMGVGVQRYKGEPYVMAADVYGFGSQTSRAGWTWYTGSAGWMYRAAMHYLLGVRVSEGNRLILQPCLPQYWSSSVEITHKFSSETTYHIVYEPSPSFGSLRSACIDGENLKMLHDEKQMAYFSIPLVDDGKKHNIDVKLV